VDHGGAREPDQRRARRAHPHDRGPDRVSAPLQALHREPARRATAHGVVRAGAASGDARRPGRDRDRRAARPRDDLARDDRRGDRPLRARDAPHRQRDPHREPHDRRLPVRAAGAGAHDALRVAARGGLAAAAAERGQAGARRRDRDAGGDARGREPDPREQDLPDPLGAPDRCRPGHAAARPFAARARAVGRDRPRDRAAPLRRPEEPRAGALMSRIDRLLRKLKEDGGSDLHLPAGPVPRMRRRGHIEEIAGEPTLDDAALRAMLAEITSAEQWRDYEAARDLDFAHAIPGVARFRANYLAQENGAAAVFRIVPERVISADELGLPPAIASLADLAKGLVLVTGPTGSGKSTTLAAVIDRINKSQSRPVVTIEDPVAFVHENQGSGVSHRGGGGHTGSFGAAPPPAQRRGGDALA